MNSDLIAERIEYGDRALSRSDLGDCPLKLARQWLEEATREGIPEANGVCLSTVSRDGCPDSRVGLVKEFDSAGPIFYTNYEGRKGKQLEAEPRAGMVFQMGEKGLGYYSDAAPVSGYVAAGVRDGIEYFTLATVGGEEHRTSVAELLPGALQKRSPRCAFSHGRRDLRK